MGDTQPMIGATEPTDPGRRQGRPGLLVVQIDGLSRPLFEQLIAAGQMPTIARLVGSGDLTIGSWAPLLPPCTPASQAGILHGSNDGIPGFRWYEKETGRLLVANRARDAAEIARRVTDGHGLLAVDGASIGNLLTGDAVSSHLTLATIEGDPGGHDRSTRGGSYPLNPLVYLRIGGLMVVDLGREAVAYLRSRGESDAHPVARGWRYVLARAVSTIPLRLLSTALVIHEMRRGRSVVYVDFTGHDEVAHTRGPRSPDARRAAESIDRSLKVILRETRHASRPYRLVVLSDHGQSWGASFTQRYGMPFEQYVASLMGGGASYHGATLPTEYDESPVRLAGHLAGPASIRARLAKRFDRSHRYRSRVGVAGGDVDEERSAGSRDPARADVVVAASGNLALISFPRIAGKLTREDIEACYPNLIRKLSEHPGIGLVLARSARGPVAVGGKGTNYLDEGRVEGEDPVAQYGPHAAASLRRLSGFATMGDLAVLGQLDAGTNDVVSFEELVGSHGGLGGWQAEPFIAYPRGWALADGEPVGAAAVNHQLRAWLGELNIG